MAETRGKVKNQRTLMEEAEIIYNNAREYYIYVRRTNRYGPAGTQNALQSMRDAKRHLQDLMYWAKRGMLDRAGQKNEESET